MDARDAVRELAERARAAGGRALLIGGAVRDQLLGRATQDFDVEVYGLPPDRVQALAQGVGAPRDVGKAFGVLELRLTEPESPAGSLSPITMHLSLPRREAKVAPGHRGFAVATDPSLSPPEAARRRDFTINAIAEDPLTGEVLDPFGGRRDLEQRVLRVVDQGRFGEDPLRVLRAAVFVAQFELTVDPESDTILRQTVPSVRQLPKERIGEEWRKLLLRPARPSLGIRLLMDWGALAVLHPDFVPLRETPQHRTWHPEGDVWTHTLLAVDEATQLCRPRESGDQIPAFAGMTDENRWRVVLATLCHDLGKAATTRNIRGVWRSIGHDAAGVEPTRRFLKSIAADTRTTEVVVRLVREHLQPLQAFNAAAKGVPVSDGAVRTLARRLHPATICLLTLVADADHRGRGPFYGEQGRNIPAPAHDAGEKLRARADQLGVLRGPPAPVLRGTDLVALGLPPSPAFGAILRRAQELRDEQGLSRDALLARLRGARTSDEALTHLSSPKS